jgi:uncharacterized protein (DUF2225 family)
MRKILIVDELDYVRALYSKTLDGASLEVLTASDGSSAIESWRSARPDLIILSLKLPGKGGLDVLREIRKKDKDVGFIVSSDDGGGEWASEALNLGVSSFLALPVDLEELSIRVKEALVYLPERPSEEVEISSAPEEEIQDPSKIQEALWDKALNCPLCGEKITTKNVRTSSYRVVERESDFRPICRGAVEPLLYEVWVCPHCLYANRREQFEELPARDKEKLLATKESRFEVADGKEFIGIRTKDAAIKSYLLAEMCCQGRDLSRQVLAGLYLRAAWLFRYLKDAEREKVYIKKSIDEYIAAFQSERELKGKLGEDGLTYLIGDLYHRIGSDEEALKYLSRLTSDKSARPEFRRMAQTTWQKIRDLYHERTQSEADSYTS